MSHPDDADDLISIRHALHDVEQEAQRGPRIVADAYKAWREAQRSYDAAQARAHLKARQTLPDKSTVADIAAEVVLNTIVERSAAEGAEAAHRYAASRVTELGNRRSSLQTRAKLLIEQMRLVGTGVSP